MSKKEIRRIIESQCDWMFLDGSHDQFMTAVLMGNMLGVVSDEEYTFLSHASIYSSY